MRIAGRIPADMLAHFPDSRIFSLILRQKGGMPQHHLPHLLYGWTGQQLAGIQIVNGSAENPWVSSGSPSDKHRIAARFLQHALRRLRSGHITVSDYRYAYRRLYPGNDVPTALSGVILLSCPPCTATAAGARFPGQCGRFPSALTQLSSKPFLILTVTGL